MVSSSLLRAPSLARSLSLPPPPPPSEQVQGGLPARINPRLSLCLDSGDSQSAEIWCINMRASEAVGAAPNPPIQPETSGGNILTALREKKQEVGRAR